MNPKIILKPGREKSLQRLHPWVFSGAIDQVSGEPASGSVVDIADSSGKTLAQGAYSPSSQIRVRVWTWDPAEPFSEALIRSRIQQAIRLRRRMISAETTDAVRLIHAESDGLPGLIVDQYGDTLVLQSLTAGIEPWREMIASELMQQSGAKGVYERSDAEVRELEGLQPRTGWMLAPDGETAAPGRVMIHENGLNYWVDLEQGHKTGLYLDQRENRKQVGELAEGKDVLDCFSYTGGFAVSALAGGAKSVTVVESSGDAIALARENVALNSLPADRVTWVEGDVFRQLRLFRDQGKSFDLIILDPPKFAPTAALAEKAARGYKDINLLAFKLLRPDGLLVTYSCSGGVSEELFQKIVAGAALDAGVEAKILRRLHQAPDHPVSLHFPEGAYLKGFIIHKGK